ncbi:hypothetical protein [Snodgrassella gandavensis]|nr:hypothetical protein [Snodgrassella gandavensis]
MQPNRLVMVQQMLGNTTDATKFPQAIAEYSECKNASVLQEVLLQQ